MDNSIIAKVSARIFRDFPEVAGSSPSVQPHGNGQVLLIFKGSGTTADGHKINRTVRVVVDTDGKILKTTTSR